MPKPPPLRRAIPEFIRVAQHFRADLARERWRIVKAMGALFVGVLAQLLEPWPLKFVIDAILTPQGDRPSSDAILGLPMGAALLAAGLAYIGIIGIRAWAQYAESVGFAVIGNRVISRLRSRLYAHLQSLPLSFHNKSRHGDLLVRVVGDVKLLRDVAVTAGLPLLASALVLIGSCSRR